MEQENKVQWIYSSQTNEELEERYDQWARDYEVDLERDFAWQGPEVAAELFAKYVSKEAKDTGCRGWDRAGGRCPDAERIS